MATFLIQQHGYYYRTNATTECKSLAFCLCTDCSDPMESVGEREGNTEVNFHPRKCHIVYIRHVPHAWILGHKIPHLYSDFLVASMCCTISAEHWEVR